MKANILRDKDTAELKKELLALLKEQFNLRMQQSSRQLAKTHQLKIVRKNIARVLTILREKQTGALSA